VRWLRACDHRSMSIFTDRGRCCRSSAIPLESITAEGASRSSPIPDGCVVNSSGFWGRGNSGRRRMGNRRVGRAMRWKRHGSLVRRLRQGRFPRTGYKAALRALRYPSGKACPEQVRRGRTRSLRAGRCSCRFARSAVVEARATGQVASRGVMTLATVNPDPNDSFQRWGRSSASRSVG
jgi:hypothetical protein